MHTCAQFAWLDQNVLNRIFVTCRSHRKFIHHQKSTVKICTRHPNALHRLHLEVTDSLPTIKNTDWPMRFASLPSAILANNAIAACTATTVDGEQRVGVCVRHPDIDRS